MCAGQCPDAIYNLAILSEKQNKYDNSEKYYLMSISQEKCTNAIGNLANLYCSQAKYDLAEKYYIMATENGSTVALYNLGRLYEKYDNFWFNDEILI